MKLRELLANASLGLRELTTRYAQYCWELGWLPGMKKKLADPDNPFCGGPKKLLEHGITTLDGTTGPINITPQSRIKFGALAPGGRTTIKGVYDKELSGIDAAMHQRSDVLHPEFVGSFDENVAVSPQHFTNNACSAAATIETVLCTVLDPNSTVEEAIMTITGILDGNESYIRERQLLNAAARNAWIGRACTDGSWASSGDFVVKDELFAEQAALDAYVVVPVLRYLLNDLQNGF